MLTWNSIRIEGNNNLVLQDIDGNSQSILFDEFLKQFTAEKDARITVLEATLRDKQKIEEFSDYKIQNLQIELQTLQEDKKLLETRVQNLVLEFSNRDISETNTLYQEAFNLFINGKLENAIDVLDEEKLLQQELEIKAKRENQAETRLLKAQLLAIKFDFIEAAYNIEKMLECLSSWHTHFEAGNFYHSLNNYSKAKDNYEQALKFEIGRSAKAGTLSNLGNIYTQLERFIDAEDTYNQALAIRRDLAKDNPNLLYALSFLLTTIGALKNINLRFSDAEKDLEESLRILRGLGEGNIPFHYHHGIAKNLVTLGNVYTNNRNFQKSERAFLNALTIFDKLLIIEPKARDFLLDSKAGCLNNLGLLYKNTNHNKESIETYSQALPIYRMLAEPNPQAHNPHLALLLSNLGTAHGNRDNFSEAVEFLTESLEIRRALTSINSQAHSSEVAETLNNLAIIYKKTGQFDKAESSYQEAIDIYKLLIADNPQIYQLELAGTAVNMAIFYIDSSPSRDKSLSLLKEAICNAYPYINTVPIANNYISTALWVVGRWNINTNTFFTDAIKEISLLHKNFSTSLKSSSTTYTVRYSSNNLSSSG